MKKNAQNSLADMMNGLVDSTKLGDSSFTKLATGMISQVLSNYAEEFSQTNLPDNPIRELTNKWRKLIFRDLAKIDVSPTEKNVMLAIALTSIYSSLYSN
jgi:hypothetical protein